MSLLLDDDARYRAVSGRDERFDGRFFTAVTSTGIYCRPSCPAVTPQRKNVRFYPTAAAAQHAGFRACLRCRPDASPGSPDWNVRQDLAGRAMRLISDGIIDREGVAGLARRLGYTERHLNRQLTEELGAGPLALARAQRAQTARTLIETTDIPLAEVTFAAGFSSIRQFNETMREIFAASPTELREKRRRLTKPTYKAPGDQCSDTSPTAAPGVISLRLRYRPPLDVSQLWRFLAARAIPGVEEVDEDSYRRALRLPHGAGIASMRPADGFVSCELRLDDLRDLSAALYRCRRMLDLDADPLAVGEVLEADPALRSRVRAALGRRVPTTPEPAESAIRAVIGQQISVAAACTMLGTLSRRYGTPLPHPTGGVTHLFPTPAQLAAADPASLPMPAGRKRTLQSLCAALADGDIQLDIGARSDELHRDLTALPGIGDWTAHYIAMRGLADPDVFLSGDLGVRRGAAALGLPSKPKELSAHAERWRPWRSYAVLYLWG